MPGSVSIPTLLNPLSLSFLKLCTLSCSHPSPPPDFSVFQEKVKPWERDLYLEIILLIKEQAAGRGATISCDFEGGNNFLLDSRRKAKCLPGVGQLFVKATGYALLHLNTVAPVGRRAEIYSQCFLLSSLLL